MFEVGDKVVCITESQGIDGRIYPGGKPQKGLLYVVGGIRTYPREVGLIIIGVPSIGHNGRDCGWWGWRFRKLTDIQAENKAKRQAKKGIPGHMGAKGFSNQDV